MTKVDAELAIVCLLLFFLSPDLGASKQNNSGSKQKRPVERVTGRLSRVAAVGGETTGWVVRLESEQLIAGSKRKSIEVDPAAKRIRLEPFRDKRVEITGTLVRRHGVERGERLVLLMESIREIPPPAER